MITYVSDKKKSILHKVIVEMENQKYKKLRIESYEEKILFSSIEKREKLDIEDFIKYRDSIYLLQK